MRGSAWLRRGWAAVRRMYPALVAALVVTALAVTLYGVSQARQHTRVSGTANVADATATLAPNTPVTTAATTATATDQPPLSGPIPTNPPNILPPSNGTGPFTVQSVAVAPGCVANCLVRQTCENGLPTFPVGGEVWLAPNAPNGDVTYRWLPSYGPATAPAVIHFNGDSPIAPFYTLTPGLALSDAQPFSVRLEVLSPNRMISQPSDNMSFICVPWIRNVDVSPATNYRIYDCQAGGSQSFSYTASLTIAPSPTYTISYYWKRSDGSVSQTWTVTMTLGETSASLHGDAISLTAPSPPPPVGPSPVATYSDTLVVLNTAQSANWSSIKQITALGADVVMPNCSDTFAPTPTPTP